MGSGLCRTNFLSSPKISFPGSFGVLSADLILRISDQLSLRSLFLGFSRTCKIFGKIVSDYDYSHRVGLEKENLNRFLENFISLSYNFNYRKKPIYFKKDLQLFVKHMPKPEGMFINAFLLSNFGYVSPEEIHSMIIGIRRVGHQLPSTSKPLDKSPNEFLECLLDEDSINLKFLSLFQVKLDKRLIEFLINLKLQALDLNECFFCESSPIFDMQRSNVKLIQLKPNIDGNGKLNVRIVGYAKKLIVQFSSSLQTSGITIDAVSCPQLESL
jgi:hypothetical protein